MRDFVEVFLYTNQTSLKRFLINNEILALDAEDEKSYSLSDRGYGGILVFNKEVSIDTIKRECCNDIYEIAVVIKLFLCKNIKVIAYDDAGKKVEGELGNLLDYSAYLVREPISFSNVSSISPVDKKIVFLYGDSTINEPTVLIKEKVYQPLNCLAAESLNKILSTFNSGIASIDNDDNFLYDEDNLNYEIGSLSESDNTDTEVIADKNYKNRILAGLLMLLQGNHPVSHELTANLYSILEEKRFEEFVSMNIYKDFSFDFSQNLEKPDEILIDFYQTLKNVSCNHNYYKTIFSSAIYAALNLNKNDKEEFRELFLSQLENEEIINRMTECLSVQRARNHIGALKEKNDEALPVYFLYTFFDYGFDRMNENIHEFGLDGTVFVPIIMSLWALKNGMKDIYKEYKDSEIVYACERKVATWLNDDKIIPINQFYKINKIKKRPDEYDVGYFRCSYQNIPIEYMYCVKHEDNETLPQLITDLNRRLDKTFSFEYEFLKQAIKREMSHTITIQADVLQKNSSEIHKTYLKLSKEVNQKENKKEKCETYKMEPMTLDMEE